MQGIHSKLRGLKPEFGNQYQIDLLSRIARVFSGQYPIHTLSWQFCQYWGATTDTGKPRFRFCDKKQADAVMDYVPCPGCGRNHVLLISFDPDGLWADNKADIEMDSQEFECWACGMEFETDIGGRVFITQPTPVDRQCYLDQNNDLQLCLPFKFEELF